MILQGLLKEDFESSKHATYAYLAPGDKAQFLSKLSREQVNSLRRDRIIIALPLELTAQMKGIQGEVETDDEPEIIEISSDSE